MPQCAIAGCNNTHRKTKGGPVRYHRFPGDDVTRLLWIRACGRHVQNCSTARVCSRHFSAACYERDVQHELLGLPTRCRLRKGSVPDSGLPARKRARVHAEAADADSSSAIAILLAVGLVPAAQKRRRANGGLPLDLNKMHVMEDVGEGCDAQQQPSSPGHADQRTDIEDSNPTDADDDRKHIPQSESTSQIEAKNTPSEDDNASLHLKSEDEANPSAADDEDEPLESKPDISPTKRKPDSDPAPSKKLKNELQEDFSLRNRILTECTESLDMANFDQIQTQTEQLVTEIQNLADLAKEKEREWNSIIHEKKLKEELLERIQRQKQVCLLSNGLEISESEPSNGQRTTSSNQHQQHRRRPDLNRHKLVQSLMNGHGGDSKCGKQRPVRDVQSIIADYRQRHPEAVPRRGRRIRGFMGNEATRTSVMNISSMALGSGSQVRHNAAALESNNDLGMLLSAMESVNQDMQPPLSTNEHHETTSFKDILMEFAKLSQSDKELLQNTMKAPPPYPEVTVHPVSTTTPPTNSLLHGILTKNQTTKPSQPDNKSAFSPTLARLLTAPERCVTAPQHKQNNTPPQYSSNGSSKSAANVSISDILSSNRARNEITITPVGTEFEASPKRKSQTEEDEAEDSVDRLVIDEGGEVVDPRGDNNSDTGDEVPQCQGCNQKCAQFVCAGCGNQWYCSRECQVSSWDEHSEVCSG